MRVLVSVLGVLAATAAPVAARPRAPDLPITLVSVHGRCDSFRVGKRDATDACNRHVVAGFAKDHVVFVFGSTAQDENDGDATLVFGGRGPIVDAGAGKHVQAVGMISFAYKGRSDPDQDAVGVCEYTDLYDGVARVACSAVTAGGRRYEAGFTTDGARPKKL